MAKATSRIPAPVGEPEPVTKTKLPPVDLERVRDISLHVYKSRLGPKDAAKMLEEDGPERMRKRAQIYDALTVAYFSAFGIDLPRIEVSLMGDP